MGYSYDTSVSVPGRTPKTSYPRVVTVVTGLRYYNPSLGRWLSRDPIEEDGGLNLYGFVYNRPVTDVDLFGLESFSDIMHFVKGLAAGLDGKPCCCANDEKPSLVEDITPSSSGATVTGTANITEHGCISKRYVFWWDCFSAWNEAPWWKKNGWSNWKDYGWSQDGLIYSKTVKGGGWLGPDTSHLAMSSMVVYISCYNGHIVVSYIFSSPVELYWTWNKKKKAWEDGYQ